MQGRGRSNEQVHRFPTAMATTSSCVDGGVRADIDLLEGRSEPSASTTASGRLTSLGDAFGDDEASVLVMVDLQSGYGFWRFTDRHRELLMERFPKVRVAVLGRRRGRVT